MGAGEGLEAFFKGKKMEYVGQIPRIIEGYPM